MLDSLISLLHAIYDVNGLIAWGGIAAICVIIFAETGLLFGFFLPGDSLLITAGIVAAAGHLNLTYLIVLAGLAAILGDQFGYYLGHKVGKRLYARHDSLLFHRSHLEKAQAFYDKHGPKTILLARFVPIVRTFAPTIAGTAGMKYRTFITYNVFGGALWVLSTVLGGYFLGRLIPHLDRYILIVIAIVIVLSFVPIGIEVVRHKRRSRKRQ